MLHFSFAFGAWLHKSEEFGVICFGGQALAPQIFPFLQGYCHHLSSCRCLRGWILAPQPTSEINRENTTLSSNCFLSAAAYPFIGIWMSKPGQFYGVLPVVTHWFFQHWRHQCLYPAQRSFSTHHSRPERAAESLLTFWARLPTPPCPPQGPYKRGKALGKASNEHLLIVLIIKN